MEGLLFGSRELLCLSSRISRTLVSCSSSSELYLLGESVSCQMQGESSAGGVTSFYRLVRRGGFSEGLGTSRRRRVIQGPTRQVGRLQVQGRDTPRRCHLTGTRHTTSLLSTRVHCPLCGYPSASFYLRRFNPFLFRRLGFFSFSITVFVTAHTLTHLRPGPSGERVSWRICLT
jgi:hypothetical protein